MIDHLTLAITLELQRIRSRHVLGIGHVHGRGNHSTRVDLGTCTEHDPIGVHKDYLAIGVDRAIDHGLRGTGHAIKR